MRIAYSGLIAVLVASAVPSVGFAQIVIPYTKAELSYTDRLAARGENHFSRADVHDVYSRDRATLER